MALSDLLHPFDSASEYATSTGDAPQPGTPYYVPPATTSSSSTTATSSSPTMPLEPGRYWVDVFQPAQARFRDWLSRNAKAVKVEGTQSFEPVDNYPARDWYVFRVLSRVTWEGPGKPTPAAESVTSSDDTVQKPDPGGGAGIGTALIVLGVAAAAGFVAWKLLGHRERLPQVVVVPTPATQPQLDTSALEEMSG